MLVDRRSGYAYPWAFATRSAAEARAEVLASSCTSGGDCACHWLAAYPAPDREAS